MKFILKILQGANAGAEIALAEGGVTFGTSDRCDIVLADSALAEEAFVLETTADGVSLRPLPGGEAKRLEPYRPVTEGGTTFAIGIEGEPWREPPPDPAPEAAPEAATPAQPPAPAPEESPCPETSEPPPRRRRAGCLPLLLALFLLLLFFAGGYFLALRYGSFWSPYLAKGGESGTAAETPAPSVEEGAESLEAWAAKNGLAVREEDGRKTVSGNFAKRGEKLEAMQDAYAFDPELSLDVSDDETLRSGVEELLFAATEGRMKLLSATNRVVAIGGKAETKEELLRTVASICSDVNHVRIVDDTAVVCGDGRSSTKPTEYRAVQANAATPFDTPAARKGMPTPKNPVAGIITKPFPCLVLRDGSRAAEGAVVGGFQIEKIEPDKVILRKGEERSVWKP